MDSGRKSLHLFLSRCRNLATKPVLSELERNRFDPAQRMVVKVLPRPPEFVVVGLRVEKTRQTVNLLDGKQSSRQVAKYVERGVTQIVDWMQNRERKVVNSSFDSP